MRDLTLEKIIATCRAAEISKQHMSSLVMTAHQQEPTVNYLNRKSKHGRQQQARKKQPRGQPTAQQRNSQPNETAPQCTSGRCGRCRTIHQPRQCPAYGSTCYACGNFGHYASVCRQMHKTTQTKVHMLGADQGDNSEQELFLGTLTVNAVED